MKINILAFGKIAEILPQQEWELAGTETAGALRIRLETEYPALKNLRYRLAVDKQLASDDTRLHDNSVVALLPPFSGG
ncbi:MAG: MoaD/ThiS family protein [Saprospiraceae bacterium]|jgi:molybdopterin synthase sulfur carrier subunit|nr:MoaD/ThiS family protein [Saprospiraceae bacterium]